MKSYILLSVFAFLITVPSFASECSYLPDSRYWNPAQRWSCDGELEVGNLYHSCTHTCVYDLRKTPFLNNGTDRQILVAGCGDYGIQSDFQKIEQRMFVWNHKHYGCAKDGCNEWTESGYFDSSHSRLEMAQDQNLEDSEVVDLHGRTIFSCRLLSE